MAAARGGTNVGGYFNSFVGPYLDNGESITGNAATTQALDALNAYYTEVLNNRPAGPVTVNALTTADNTPTISGSVTLGVDETLTVIVNGVQYSSSTSPAVVVSGTSWSLTLTSPLATGSYEVSATITDAEDYTLSDNSAGELVITGGSATVSGSFSANDKQYDGTTTATGSVAGLRLSGIASNDTVSIASATIAFQTATVGTGKSVVITNVTLTGPQASFYSANLTDAPTTTANITSRTLTIGGSFTTNNKAYDGSATASSNVAGLALVGAVAGDEVALATVVTAFGTASVGDAKSVGISSASLSGAAASNYSLSLSGAPTATANITSKTLTVGGSFSVANKIYDATVTATITTSSWTLNGIVGSESVSLSGATAAFDSPNVGTGKTVTLTGGTLSGAAAANYVLSLAGAPTTTANITQKPVTVGGSFAAANKVYDGSASATITSSSLTLSGVLGSDDVSLTAVTAAFGSATVGTAKPVSLASAQLTGAQAGNYALSLTGAPTTTATISTAGGTVTLGGTFTANNKVYDGTTGRRPRRGLRGR